MSLVSTLRTIFTLGRGVLRGLPEASVDRDPIELFQEWFEAARKGGLFLPEAMTLSTATPDGKPSARLVLLKGVDERGFTFFTNYESRKARELARNPHAALTFHWAILQRQVRVEGRVRKLSEDESYAYFKTRSRGSQIGAWASHQSSVLDDRATLEARVREMETRFEGEDVPLPPFWGGFLVEPEAIEFWQGRTHRLHDRLRFTREDGGDWETVRLYP